MSFREVAIFVAAEWKKLADNERKPYAGLADVDQLRFKREKQAWARLSVNDNALDGGNGAFGTPTAALGVAAGHGRGGGARRGAGRGNKGGRGKKGGAAGKDRIKNFEAIEVLQIKSEQEEVHQLALELAADYKSSSMVSVACQTDE